jgi:hypothetical protein
VLREAGLVAESRNKHPGKEELNVLPQTQVFTLLK